MDCARPRAKSNLVIKMNNKRKTKIYYGKAIYGKAEIRSTLNVLNNKSLSLMFCLYLFITF